MDGYSQAVVVYGLIVSGLSLWAFWEVRQKHRIEANIRRLEALEDQQAREAAARAHPAE